MITIGNFLKDARLTNKVSKSVLVKETKIKREYIEAIEKEDWNALPVYPVVQGFVRSIAKAVGVNESHASALLRRDYPPKSLKINPNPEPEDKLKWSPKFTYLLGVTLIFIAFATYLVIQYISFVKAPALLVLEPEEGSLVAQDLLVVVGTTDPQATVKVNNQPALVAEDGSFSTEIEISESTQEIVVVSLSRAGKETVIHRNIKTDLN